MWLLLSLFLALPLAGQQRAPGNSSIDKDQLKADLYFLASDAMRGRLTGSREYELAAEYIQSRFARLGLKAAVGDSMFHRFDLVLSRLDEPNRLQIGRRQGKLLEDFYPTIFSPNASASAPTVLAGYGIQAPELGWDDYKGKNVKGAIALILDGDPSPDDPQSIFDGVVTSEYANSLRKVLSAQEAGADGVLIVNATNIVSATNGFPAAARAYWPERPPHLEKYTLALLAGKIRIPVAQISPAFAAELLRPSGRTLKQAVDESAHGAARGGAGPTVEFEVSLKRTIVEDRNVVAKIEGSDARLKDEAVIVSAHYDHNGADGDQIFNGADDNASGVAALLEIAEAYALAAAQGQRPQRTVIFASWGSEERCCGPLLGAWAWVEDESAWPLAKTVAALNMDMIGRSEEVPESAGRRFNGLAAQTAASNAQNVNILGWSFSPDPPLRQYQVPTFAAKRSMAFFTTARAGVVLPYRAAPGLSHLERPARTHRLWQGGTDRAAGPSVELGLG